MIRPPALLALVLVCLPAGGAVAITLDFPAPATVTAQTTDRDTLTLPAGPWQQGALPTRTRQGAIRQMAWSLDGPVETASLVTSLRGQIESADFEVSFSCAAAQCGGYDFRFAMPVLPAPEMFVDLGDYHYLLAEGTEGELLSLLVSRGGSKGYVQLTTVAAADAPVTVTSSKSLPTAPAGPIWTMLEDTGHAPLDDLLFAPGSARLEADDTGSLSALATGLRDRPGARIALVGHTDADGTLAANMDLSRRRARAVRQALIEDGIAADRIVAEGVAYLAPRNSNGDEEGREANRRVEAVLLN